MKLSPKCKEILIKCVWLCDVEERKDKKKNSRHKIFLSGSKFSHNIKTRSGGGVSDSNK